MEVIGDFAYLDKERVESFLTAYEGGLVTARKKISSKGGSLGLSKIAEIQADKSSSVEEQIAVTTVSQFYKLYHLLDKDDGIQLLTDFDEDIWNDLRGGEFVETYAHVERAPLENFFEQAKSIFDIGVRFGAIDPNEKSNQQAIRTISLMHNESETKLRYFATPLGTPSGKYRFLTTLEKGKMVLPSDDMIGKFYLFGRITNVLEKGEYIDLFKLGGINLPRAEMRKLIKAFSKVPIGKPIQESDIKVKYPTIQITPIALYR